MRPSRTRQNALAVAALLAAMLLPAIASAEPSATSEAAHLCQQGGYLTLTRQDGTPFTNVGDCVSYAAQGGVLRQPGASVSIVETGKVPKTFCQVQVTGAGLLPNTEYGYTIVINDTVVLPATITTDPSGGFVQPQSVDHGDTWVIRLSLTGDPVAMSSPYTCR